MVSPEYLRSRRELLTFINCCSPVHDFGNESATASAVSISVSQDGGGKMKSVITDTLPQRTRRQHERIDDYWRIRKRGLTALTNSRRRLERSDQMG